MYGITDEVLALDFDLACTYLLLKHDNKQRRAEVKLFAAILGAEIKDSPSDIDFDDLPEADEVWATV